MAILKAESATQNQSRPSPQPARKPPLFVRTLLEKGAVSRSISCSLLPPHALGRSSTSRSSPPSLKSCRQLVVSTSTAMQVLDVDDDTLSLRPLTDVMLFDSAYDIAAVATPVPGRDALVVLSARSTISFMQFDDAASRLHCAGQQSLDSLYASTVDTSVRAHPRLLATHPQKRMVAVASLTSQIRVFPVIFLPKQINAGKIASVEVDGVVLSIDFLEDDDSVHGDAFLVALLQRGKHQLIALFSVGVPPDSSGGLSVTPLGSMITCALHPDDVAVARATSKLTGQGVQPAPPAVAVTRLSGCPYLFAVFVRGKIIAGDARPVIANARSGDSLSVSVRVEDDSVAPLHSSHSNVHTAARSSSPLTEDAHFPRPASPDVTSSDNAPRTPEMRVISRSGSSGDHSVVGTPTSTAAASSSNDGYLTPVQTPVSRREPPAAPLQTRRTRRHGRDDIPILAPLVRRSASIGGGFSLAPPHRSMGEDYLSYYYIPSYITREIDDCSGIATAWVNTKDHFHEDDCDVNGLYFVMENGAMYVLKWSDGDLHGATTFCIPSSDRSRPSSKRKFSVEYIGDVGPAVSIASLDRRLIYIANDGADGSLRRLHLPHSTYVRRTLDMRISASTRRNSGRIDGGRYGLEVRQEFLNLSPISDFIIAPPVSFSPEKKRVDEVPLHRSLRHSEKWNMDLLWEQDDPEDQSALDYVLDGGREESELIVCSGIGRYGCIRFIRPGSPVSIFASTDRSFIACNDMWSVRFTKKATFDAAVILTFAQHTRALLSVPVSTFENTRSKVTGSAPNIARLVDGTDALDLLADCRTICIGLIEDGVLAQIHEGGVRLMFLRKADDNDLSDFISSGVFHESLCEHTMQWTPPFGWFISVGTIGAGFILVSVIRKNSSQCVLYLLKCYPGDPSLGLFVVSSIELDHELSCIEIPEWTITQSESSFSSPRLPPMAILGTYAPAIEIRLLGPTMECVAKKTTFPWLLHPSQQDLAVKRSTADKADTADLCRLSSRGSRGEDSFQSSAKASMEVMTAVPESLCAVEIDRRRFIFAGLRDGSVLIYYLDDRDTADMNDSGSPSAGANLLIKSHRKIGDRPVVLKSVMSALGKVVIGQAERPWLCMSKGGGNMSWSPLAFIETRAVCSFAVPGAERCFAAAAADDSFYICGLRRRNQVSVRSLHVGATPRRVLSVRYPKDSIVVATSGHLTTTHFSEHAIADGEGASKRSELLLYDRRERCLRGCISMMQWELIHVLLNWVDFIVVGTSLGSRSFYDSSSQRLGKRGRLLMFMICDSPTEGASDAPSTKKFELCSEVIFPGAILAGAVSSNEDFLVISCHTEVLVFNLIRSKGVLVEVARVSARTLVVGLSTKEDIVCIVDRKDSIGFFQVKPKAGKLVRDRSDHMRRIVSDVALVDRTLALAVDRFGGFFSIGYDDGDDPPRLDKGLRTMTAMSSSLLRSLRSIETPSIADSVSRLSQIMPAEFARNSNIAQFPVSDSERSTDSNEQVDNSIDRAESQGTTGGAEDNIENNLGAPDQSEDGSGDAGAMGALVYDDMDDDSDYEDDIQEDSRHNNGSIPRNLVSHHSFNMRDTALRIRIGTFGRKEVVLNPNQANRSNSNRAESFPAARNVSAFCGTLGGAIVSAVGMPAKSFSLLSKVEAEMAAHSEIAEPALGPCHKKMRSCYGPRAVGTIDGDLLSLFDELSDNTKRDIANRVGCDGEYGVLLITGMIHELCDRVI